jgi:beta-lactamase superfamily II metal-dependent hydrolase
VRIAAFACVLWFGGVLLAAAWPVKTPTVDRFALPKSSVTLIRAADQAVLIDPGSASHRSGAFTLRRAVAACGAWRVRTAIVTGPQTERFDHLPELVRALGIETVLVPPSLPAVAAGAPDGDPARLLRRLEELGVTVRTLEAGQALALGGVAIEVERPGVVRLRLGDTEPQRLELPAIEAWEHREPTP